MAYTFLGIVDALLAGIEAALEERRIVDHDLADVGVQVGAEMVELDLRLLQVASGGDDVDHPRHLRERRLEPLGDESIQLVGVNVGPVGAGLRGSVLAVVGGDDGAVRARAERS